MLFGAQGTRTWRLGHILYVALHQGRKIWLLKHVIYVDSGLGYEDLVLGHPVSTV